MFGLSDCYNIADLRTAAKRRLPRWAFEYVDRGAENESLLQHNLDAITRLRLVPRFAVDCSGLNPATTLLGAPASMPLAVAPTGTAGLVWYEGEIALARAAVAAGVPFTMATGSLTSLEKLARAVSGRLWFQLYVWRDQDLALKLVDRAAAADYETLIVTVDTPVSPNREYNRRNGFGLPFRPSPQAIADMLLHPRWLIGTLGRYVLDTGLPQLRNHPPEANTAGPNDPIREQLKLNAALNWDDVARLRDRWPRKFMVKGLMHPADAVRAAQIGADGVVISNHGGRNHDAHVASFDILPDVVAAVAGRTTVIVDSGVRRGGDILKAVALGAQGVLVGRATLFGTAAAGEAGAALALKILREELINTMGMTGCPTIADIGPAVLAERIDGRDSVRKLAAPALHGSLTPV
jgi:isopentenyl diphosphate isomerase/L-lactate dehydrogenase-like FMN-dependent dehydrogenase